MCNSVLGEIGKHITDGLQWHPVELIICRSNNPFTRVRATSLGHLNFTRNALEFHVPIEVFVWIIYTVDNNLRSRIDFTD